MDQIKEAIKNFLKYVDLVRKLEFKTDQGKLDAIFAFPVVFLIFYSMINGTPALSVQGYVVEGYAPLFVLLIGYFWVSLKNIPPPVPPTE